MAAINKVTESDVYPLNPKPSLQLPSPWMMTVKGGAAPACAACKFQRRKCSPNCPLAPYFPVSKSHDFDCVHRLFGVSNVTKTILRLQTKNERDDAMTAIIFEARMRKLSPVHGCAGIVVNLFRKLELATQELQRVMAQLEACRGPGRPGEAAPVGSNPGQEIDARHLFWLNHGSNVVGANVDQIIGGNIVNSSVGIGDGNVFGSLNHGSSSNDVTTAYLKPEVGNAEQIMGDEPLQYLTTLDPWGDEVKYNTLLDTFKYYHR